MKNSSPTQMPSLSPSYPFPVKLEREEPSSPFPETPTASRLASLQRDVAAAESARDLAEKGRRRDQKKIEALEGKLEKKEAELQAMKALVAASGWWNDTAYCPTKDKIERLYKEHAKAIAQCEEKIRRQADQHEAQLSDQRWELQQQHQLDLTRETSIRMQMHRHALNGFPGGLKAVAQYSSDLFPLGHVDSEAQ